MARRSGCARSARSIAATRMRRSSITNRHSGALRRKASAVGAIERAAPDFPIYGASVTAKHPRKLLRLPKSLGVVDPSAALSREARDQPVSITPPRVHAGMASRRIRKSVLFIEDV